MTQNKEAIEALDVMYEALKEYTGDADPLPNTREYIRTALQEPEVDVNEIVSDAQNKFIRDYPDCSTEELQAVAWAIHKRGLIRGCERRSVKQQMDDLQTLSKIRTPPKKQKQ